MGKRRTLNKVQYWKVAVYPRESRVYSKDGKYDERKCCWMHADH